MDPKPKKGSGSKAPPPEEGGPPTWTTTLASDESSLPREVVEIASKFARPPKQSAVRARARLHADARAERRARVRAE